MSGQNFLTASLGLLVNISKSQTNILTLISLTFEVREMSLKSPLFPSLWDNVGLGDSRFPQGWLG